MGWPAAMGVSHGLYSIADILYYLRHYRINLKILRNNSVKNSVSNHKSSVNDTRMNRFVLLCDFALFMRFFTLSVFSLFIQNECIRYTWIAKKTIKKSKKQLTVISHFERYTRIKSLSLSFFLCYHTLHKIYCGVKTWHLFQCGRQITLEWNYYAISLVGNKFYALYNSIKRKKGKDFCLRI